MTGDELRAARQALKLTQALMGEHIAQLLNRTRAYSVQEVNAWECERRAVPAKVEAALLRAKMEQR